MRNGFPDIREGVVYNHITDTQQGYRSQFTDNWAMRITDDVYDLRHFIHGHVHSGDCIEWNAVLPEDQKYREFRAGINRTQLPYTDICGNHDLSTYNIQANRRERSADEWASEVVERPSANNVMIVGEFGAVVSFTPDYWRFNDTAGTYYPPEALSASTLSWLDATLMSLSDKRVWFNTHGLPATQDNDTVNTGDTGVMRNWNDLHNMVAAHSNVVGWFSGHAHKRINDPRAIRSIPVGGRRIFGINGPSSCGLVPGTTPAQHQWEEFARSLFVTDLGDSIAVRWRNHLTSRWVAPFGENVKVYSHA